MKQSDYREFRDCCGAPQRICWAVAEHDGKRSICPLGWKMWTSFAPPMIAISVAPSRFTHDLIAESGEFVLAWPGADLAEETLVCGTRSGRDLDKFQACDLATQPAAAVGPPLIADCLANLECRVDGRLTTGDHTIFAADILAFWVRDDANGGVLCQVGEESGYEFLLQKGMYRFGVVKP